MTAGKLRGMLESVYLLGVGAFLLWDIPYMTEAEWTFGVRGCFPAVWLALAAMGLVLTRFRLGAGWWMALLLGWMTAVSAYRGVLAEQLTPLCHGLLAFLVILPAARAVRFERLMRCLRAVLAVWTAFLTAQAAIGLWAALSGHAVFSLKWTWRIGVNLGDNRLYLNAYVTTGAVKMGLSALLALWGAAAAKRWPVRILYGLCAVLQLVCLSLTDCRTAFIAVGAGLGLMAGAWILRAGGQGTRRWLRAACAVAAVLALTAGVYASLSGTLKTLAPHVQHEVEDVTMLELPAHLLPEAAAETDAVQHREIEPDNPFNDRHIIWGGALRLLGSEPRFLLTGTTTVLAPELTNRHTGSHDGPFFQHVHNIYLQTLVSWGVPGLAMLVAFLVLFLLAAFRVLVRHDLPLALRLVPVPTLYVMLCEMVDCFTRLSENSPLLLLGCLFAGLTFAVDARARLAAHAAAPVAAAVDVIVPVYNARAYVARAVRSALEAKAARVILVDDGSTDGSGDICDALAAQDARVTVLHQPNRGASAARNAGLDAATAEYVAFLDADDMLLPGSLAALTQGIGGAQAIQGRIVRDAPQEPSCARPRCLAAREALAQALTDPTAHLLCHGWLFRRTMLTGRFDERLTMGEDGEWLLRTLLQAETAAMTDAPAYRYTLRAESALHGGTDDVNGAYLRTLSAAEPSLAASGLPAQSAMYRLTHLLLMCTHGDLEAALRLRDEAPFAAAFEAAPLTGLSLRTMVLRLLKRRRYGPARLAVRFRRWQNRFFQTMPMKTEEASE